MPDLTWLPAVAQGSPWAMLGLGIVAVLTGRLVPARTMEARMKDKDGQLKDKDSQITLWHSAYEREAEARKIGEAQVDKLIDGQRTTNLLIGNLSRGGGQ